MDIITLPEPFRNTLHNSLRDLTGTRVEIVGTGGGCEAVVVGPLENGGCLFITDGDAGIPDAHLLLHGTCPVCTEVDPYGECACAWQNGAWIVSNVAHGWYDECENCGDCWSENILSGPDGDLTIATLVMVVRDALSGYRDVD